MVAVDGFGWVQGNGGGISQRGRFNAPAMAEEDAWETVNFVRGFVVLRGFVFVTGICICLRGFVLFTGICFVCLRVLYLFTNSLELVLCLEREPV
jgi:hypothetical protein